MRSTLAKIFSAGCGCGVGSKAGCTAKVPLCTGGGRTICGAQCNPKHKCPTVQSVRRQFWVVL